VAGGREGSPKGAKEKHRWSILIDMALKGFLAWNGEISRAAVDGQPRAAVPTQGKIQIPRQAREARDFHKRQIEFFPGVKSTCLHSSGENTRLGRTLQRINGRPAPNPVVGLWTGCTRLKTYVVMKRDFSLTGFVEGVQQDRSLTAS
jgi:hypothetical protein